MPYLPAASIGSFARLSPPTVSQWVQRRILTGARYGQCTEAHAVEAVVASALKRAGIKDLTVLRAMMGQLRPELLRYGATGIPAELDAVCVPELRRAQWAHGPEELAAGVRIGRPVIVVPMADQIRDVLEAFRQEVRARIDRDEGPRFRVMR